MSKRKPATALKHAHSPKIVAKAQRAAQAIIRSPKDNRLRSVPAGSTESPHNDSKNEASHVSHEAPRFENPATVLQDDFTQTMTGNDSKKGFDFASPTAKLLEMAQANLQFAFEFAQKLATIRSPVEFLSVTAVFTSKRVAMFQKHSKEMAELSNKR